MSVKSNFSRTRSNKSIRATRLLTMMGMVRKRSGTGTAPPGELLRLRGRTANEEWMGNAFHLRLAKVAIGKLVQGVWGRDVVHLRLSTSLPADHMRDANELKEALLGQHLIQPD